VPAVLRSDTIAAAATPFGMSGIAVIRVSGPEALAVARRIFRPSNRLCDWKSHHLYHGDIVCADGETVLDEILIAFMRKPRSFTGEDVVEISCHGNPVIIQSILDQLQKLGCRLAGPGEFSQRAFLNNRFDLSQAEALASMIGAQSEKAYAVGLAQLKGSLSKEIETIRGLVIEALALMEASIDFAEDTAEAELVQIPPQINQAMERMQRLLTSYRFARAYSEGVHVVITGKPNVGKSSLLNALAGKKKAIVTDIPGTTRDLIADTIHIGGIPVHLTDTAGIREPQNVIEQEGIALVWKKLAEADIVIIMLDVSKPLTEEDKITIDKNTSEKIIVAVNKIDLPRSWETKSIANLFPPHTKFLEISAKSGSGLEELKRTILDLSVDGETESTSGAILTNLRHKHAVEQSLKNIQNAKESVTAGLSAEFIAFDLREALDHLDEITGKKINDEILDRIFSSFCIGK